MLERRRNLNLPQEPVTAEHRGDLWLHDLDRHLAMVLQIMGEIHGGHATCTEFTRDGVAVGEGRLEASETVGHSGVR